MSDTQAIKDPPQATMNKGTPTLQIEAPLHKILGVSPEYTRGEFMHVVNQRKDLTAKLKAMKPLLKDLGVDLDLTETKQQTQIVVHMAEANTATPLAARFDVVEPSLLQAPLNESHQDDEINDPDAPNEQPSDDPDDPDAPNEQPSDEVEALLADLEA